MWSQSLLDFRGFESGPDVVSTESRLSYDPNEGFEAFPRVYQGREREGDLITTGRRLRSRSRSVVVPTITDARVVT